MKTPTLICVDDEAIILMSLKMELKNLFEGKYRYEIAQSGEEALALVHELENEHEEVAVIITDWLMPGIKGDQLLAEAHKLDPTIKGIIITGQADEEAIQKAMQLPNLLKIIRKPWIPSQLKEALNNI